MMCRGRRFAILQRLGCPDALSIISGFHNHRQASVCYNGSNTKTFPVTRDVKQTGVRSRTHLVHNLFLSTSDLYLSINFHPLSVFCSTHVGLESC